MTLSRRAEHISSAPPGHDAADRADPVPLLDQARILPACRRFREGVEMHAVIGEAQRPRLFHRVAQDRREPRDHVAERLIRHKNRAARRRVEPTLSAQRTSLRMSKIEGRQLVGGKREHGVVDAVEIVARVALAHDGVDLRELGEDIALQLRYLRSCLRPARLRRSPTGLAASMKRIVLRRRR